VIEKLPSGWTGDGGQKENKEKFTREGIEKGLKRYWQRCWKKVSTSAAQRAEKNPTVNKLVSSVRLTGQQKRGRQNWEVIARRPVIQKRKRLQTEGEKREMSYCRKGVRKGKGPQPKKWARRPGGGSPTTNDRKILMEKFGAALEWDPRKIATANYILQADRGSES